MARGDRTARPARAKPPAPRRLLVVCHSHPQISRGGAEIVAYEQFRRARDDGAEAWFLASNATDGTASRAS